MDVFLRILGFEKEKLRDHQVRDVVVDLRAQKDDSLFEKPAENVVRAFAAVSLFHYHRYERHHVPGNWKKKNYLNSNYLILAFDVRKSSVFCARIWKRNDSRRPLFS